MFLLFFTLPFPVGATQLISSSPTSCPVEAQCSIETGALITGGGGFSQIPQHETPDYQQSALKNYFKSATNLPPSSWYDASRRAYPDIAMFGHGYMTYSSGAAQEVDGTSASSPVFAAFVSQYNDARAQQGLPALGFLNYLLYQTAASTPSAFNDITTGSNRCADNAICCDNGFHAGNSWDPVTGLGAPNFQVLGKILVPGGITGTYSDHHITGCSVTPADGSGGTSNVKKSDAEILKSYWYAFVILALACLTIGVIIGICYVKR